jgi:tetratricopeptide (TPR) repeat protein
MWSGSYTFDVGLLQAIESEVAAEVIHVLRTGTPGQQSQRLSSQKAPNPAARAAHLEGLQSLRKLDTVSVGKAIEQFQTAVRLDRSFAEAWASLANAWVLAAQVSGIPPAEVSGKIRRYATQALQLDSSLGDPHFSLAICAEYEYDWPAAEREFLAGLALSPFSATGHLWYAKYLALTGRSREVLVHRTIGAELDPTSPYAIQSVAGYWSVAGEYRQAISGFRSALAIDPGFRLARQGLAIAYLLDGNPDRAIAELEAANRDEQGLRIRSLLGYTYARTGRLKEARAILAEFEERERRGPFPALAIAHIHIGLGDKDRAFAWLEKAVDQRDLSVTLQWDSLYVPLRSDERYHKLLRRMRLA